MKNSKHLVKIFSALLIFLGLFAGSCNDSNEDPSANVVNMELSDTTIRVGEGTVLSVEFSFSANPVFSDNEDIFVVVHLPNGLDYRNDTAEIDGRITDEDVSPRLTFCSDSGETYLLFVLDRYDLDNADNPSGDADARLTLTVDAVDATVADRSLLIDARADGNEPVFSCNDTFAAEGALSLRVVS